MDMVARIRENAKKRPKTIVLPEGHDERVRRAAEFIRQEKIARVILLEKDKLPADKVAACAELYFQARAQRGISKEEALKTAASPVFYGAMLVKEGLADGFVAGAATTTADVARAALYILGIDKRMGIISSCFIMIIPGGPAGEAKVFLFADCAIIPEPAPRQLAQIAAATAELARKVLGLTPRVAMLSYSTKGSARGQLIERTREATALLRLSEPGLIVEGELQVDAAIVPEVARLKNPGSPIQGDANILIFPNLEAGNISYKLVERLSGGRAIGPLLLGIAKPCSDLSRGCDWQDVVDCVAVTALRA